MNREKLCVLRNILLQSGQSENPLKKHCSGGKVSIVIEINLLRLNNSMPVKEKY
jgi:hypothetical protein